MKKKKHFLGAIIAIFAVSCQGGKPATNSKPGEREKNSYSQAIDKAKEASDESQKRALEESKRALEASE